MRRVIVIISVLLVALALVWYGFGFIGEAAPEADNVHRLDPEVASLINRLVDDVNSHRYDTDRRLQLGKVYHAHFLLGPARKCYEQVIASDSEHAQAHYFLGLLAQDAGKSADAVGHFRRTTEHAPEYASGWAALGVACLDDGRIEDARRAFDSAIDTDSGNGEAWSGLARIALLEGRPEKAIEITQRHLIDTSNRAYAYRLLVEAYRAQGNSANAEVAAQQAGPIAEPWRDPWREGMTGLRTGRDARRKKADYLYGLGQFEDAIAIYEELVAESPDDIPLRNILGAAYGQANRFDKARAVFEQGLARNPEYLQLRLNLARTCLFMAGRDPSHYADARYHAKLAIERDPSAAYAHLYLAQALAGLGENEAAIQSFLKAYERDAQNPHPLIRAGMLELQLGRPGEALQHLDRAVAAHPSAGDAHLARARALIRLDKLDDAEHAIDRGAAAGNASPRALESTRQHLARARAAQTSGGGSE